MEGAGDLMLVDRTALERHRKAIQRDANGWFIWGELDRLVLGCHVEHL
jgi:hypothetical protein